MNSKRVRRQSLMAAVLGTVCVAAIVLAPILMDVARLDGA